jgi:uncharacterized membrane protein (DUF106 family)
MKTQEAAKRHTDTVSGVSNISYDLMVTMTNMLEGMAALEEYKMDAEEANDTQVLELFNRIEQRMRTDAEEVRELLIERMGPFRKG